MESSERIGERGLWKAVLAGDERAWRVWYEASFAPLYATVLWRCAGLRDMADEIVGETWLTAIRRLRQFDPERASFLTWLRGIAANVARNHVRRQQRHPTQSIDGVDVPTTADDDEARRGEAERVAQALADLPEHYEEVLRAKYLEQKSVAEIASARKESAKAVESLLGRAREALRAALGSENPVCPRGC